MFELSCILIHIFWNSNIWIIKIWISFKIKFQHLSMDVAFQTSFSICMQNVFGVCGLIKHAFKGANKIQGNVNIFWIFLKILYIKATVVVSVCVGNAWKIVPITTCSLWSYNLLQRKKKSGAVWFFEAKDLVDQKKNI